MQEIYTPEELDTKINPPLHSGNIKIRHFSEEEQAEIAQHFQAHGGTSCYSKYAIGKPRLQLILGKFGVKWESHTRKPKAKPPVPVDKLDKMLGRNYEYMTFPRKVTGYSFDEEYIYLQTRLLSTGAQRQVRYKHDEISKMEREFRMFKEQTF